MDFYKSAFVAPAVLPRAGCQLSVSAVRGAPLVSSRRVSISTGRQSPRMDLTVGAQVLAATTIAGVGSFVVLRGRNKSKKDPKKQSEDDASDSDDDKVVGLKKDSDKQSSSKSAPKKSVSSKSVSSKSAPSKSAPKKAPTSSQNGPAPTSQAIYQPQPPKEDKKKKKSPPKEIGPIYESVGVDMSKYFKDAPVAPRGFTKVKEASEERLQAEVQWALSLLLDIDSCDAAVIVNARNKIIASAGPLSNNVRDAGSVVSRVSKSKEPVIESAEVGLSVPFVSSGAKSYGVFPAGDDGVVVAIASRYANFIGNAERSLAESICSRIGRFPLENYSMAK